MNENVVNIFETTFNILYLIAIWWLVIRMTQTQEMVRESDRKVAGLLRVAFLLLAIGDTGHVGFRSLGVFTGGVDQVVNVLGDRMSLAGLGTLTTSFTVTLFYMLFVYVWRARFNQKSSWVTNLLLGAGLLRLMMMALPGNEWGNVVPPQPMSLYRNIPLIVQGVGIISLFLLSAYRANDATFKWIGWMIVLSFAFYIPVILFAQQIPALGMLMIPKTCAYLAAGFIAYRQLWPAQAKPAPANA